MKRSTLFVKYVTCCLLLLLLLLLLAAAAAVVVLLPPTILPGVQRHQHSELHASGTFYLPESCPACTNASFAVPFHRLREPHTLSTQCSSLEAGAVAQVTACTRMHTHTHTRARARTHTHTTARTRRVHCQQLTRYRRLGAFGFATSSIDLMKEMKSATDYLKASLVGPKL